VLWIVGWQLGPATAGLFAICNYVVFLINPIALGVSNSLSPLAVQTYLHSGLERVRLLIGVAMGCLAAVILLFSLIAYWQSDFILTRLYNDPALQGHGVLILLLGINMALCVTHMMNDQGVWAIERPEWLLRSTLLTVIVTVVLAVPLISQWNLNGAALSLIFGRIVGLSYQSAKFYLSEIRSQSPRMAITKFSIVTPTLNAARFITTCLKSVQEQRSATVEVQHLILDGGSTDGTVEFAAGYPVTFVPRPRGMKLVDAICLGFEQADGDLIAFLGADDVLAPGALEAIAETFQSECREALFCRTRWVDERLKSLGELAPAPNWLTAHAHASLGWCYMSASSTFITPQLYRAIGGFDRSYTKSSDYEFYTRMLNLRIPCSRVQKTVSMYRRHNDNESLKKDAEYWRDCDMVRQSYAPKSKLVTTMWAVLLKAWIYGRNPRWAFHQIRRKLRTGSIRG